MTAVKLLDKLDGIRLNKRKAESEPQRMEDYLQLPDDYETRTSEPGKKRVTMTIFTQSISESVHLYIFKAHFTQSSQRRLSRVGAIKKPSLKV